MFESSERSSFWEIAVGGSLAGGLGYGLYSGRENIFNAIKSNPGASHLQSSLKKASSFSNFNVGESSAISSLSGEELRQTAMNMEGGLPFVKSNIKQAAYEALASTRSLAPEEILSSLSVLKRQETPLDTFNAAISVINSKQGDLSTFSNSIKNFASSGSERISTMGSAVASSGSIGNNFSNFISPSSLSEPEFNKFLSLQKNVLASNPAGFNIDWKIKNINDTIAGQTTSTRMAIADIEGSRLGIPLSENTPFVYGGKNFNTRYTPRQGYTVGGKLLSYQQLSESLLTDAVSKAGNRTVLKQNLTRASSQLVQDLWDENSAGRAAAVWNLPEPIMPSGARAKARLTLKEAVGYGVEQGDVEGLLGKGLYPYTSPSAAGKGTLISTNISEDLFGPLGKLVSAEQRPTQFVRSEWGASAASKQTPGFRGAFGYHYPRVDRKIKGSGYDKFLYGKYNSSSAEAYSAPQLFTFYAKPGVGDGVGFASERLNSRIAAEEGIISQSAQKMMEYERVVQKKILLDKDILVNESLLARLKGRDIGELVEFGGTIKGGDFIGIERDTGRELFLDSKLDSRNNLFQNVVGAELTGENEANVFIKEKRKLVSGEYWKMFSEENKFMMGIQNEKEFSNTLEAAGIRSPNVAGQKIEALQSGKLVARNKMALVTQQIEATSAFLGNKIDTGQLDLTPEISSFLNNPSGALKVKELLSGEAANADLQIQKNLVGLAKGWGFSQVEMQRTFGLTSKENLKSLVGSGSLRAKEAYGILQSPGVVGLGKGRLGDLASGAWGRGSFEQSGFRMLSMKGEEGLEFAGELSKRVLGKGELLAADKVLESTLGQESFLGKLSRSSLPSFADLPDFNLESGGYYSTGTKLKAFGGSDSLYVPGMDEASGLMKGMVSGDKKIDSPLVSEMKSFQNVLRKYSSSKTGVEELEIAAENLRNKTIQIAEEQTAARGKIVGSQIFTGVRKTFEEDPDVFRVSETTTNRMFKDLISRSSSSSQTDFLQAQKESLLAGKSIVGGMWRHPTSGPESFQFVKYKMDKTLAEGMVAAPTKFGTLNIGGKSRKVDISEMVGFAGDFDRDQYVLSAISERSISDKVRKNIDNGMRTEYTNYLFNHYGMKDALESKIGNIEEPNINSIESLTQGYRKLTTAKTTTGQVNIALQKLKLGLQYSAPQEYRPMADLFFHLEQAAIGGKHGVLETDLYQSIAEATKGGAKGRETMENVLTSLFGESLSAKGSITDAAGNTSQLAFSLNMKRAADVAISSYDAVSKDVDIAMEAASIAKGKQIGDTSLNKLVEQFYSRRSGSIDVSQSLMEGNARNANSFMSQAARMTKGLNSRKNLFLGAIDKAKKPILAGVAAAAAISFLSPSISGKLSPDNIGPSDNRSMSPPPGRMNASPRVYDFGSEKQTNYANIKMDVEDYSNLDNFRENAHSLGRSNIQMSDNRSILDPQSLANKIHERL